MKLLVTGADGMLGRRVVEHASRRGHDTVAIDIEDGDLTDAGVTRALITGASPAAIVHCAAYVDVDGAELHEAEAFAVNATATENVGLAASEAGARVVAVSTDYVFDGELHTRPYVESDAPSPLGAYGRSKRAGEEALARACEDHVIARTAWLFGHPGRNFPDTMLRAASSRDEVAVVVDQVGSPTWTGHLAPALVALAEGSLTGPAHVAGSGQCSWHGLCVELYRQAGVATRVDETTAREFVRPAPRPSWSVLASEREGVPVLPPWQEGVAGFLSERNGT